jgi:hypothetical protein
MAINVIVPVWSESTPYSGMELLTDNRRHPSRKKVRIMNREPRPAWDASDEEILSMGHEKKQESANSLIYNQSSSDDEPNWDLLVER